MKKEAFADRFYRALLRLLPFEFRTEFGPEMREVFRKQRLDTGQSGRMALLKMWSDTILDLFRMAPREHWGVLSSDARYALRMMQKSPGFAFAAVLILGLAIGVNTAIFSVINSVLLKSLPYVDGDRLVVLRHPERKLGNDDAFFSVDEIRDYRRHSRTLNKVVEYHTMTFTLFGKGEANRVRTGIVSADFFNVFGVQPLLGRTFVESDDRPGTIKQGLTLVVLGVLAGVAGALAFTRSLTNLLFQVTPQDIATYVSAVFLLLLFAVVACYLPARRAARIDPQVALRCE